MKSLTIDPKNIFYRTNTVYGYIEVVDAVSGEVLAVQQDYSENFILGKMDALIKADINGREVYFQKGISIPEYKPPSLGFSRPLADILLEDVTEGTPIAKACKKRGISYSTVMRWAKINTQFGEELETAKRYAADIIHNKITDLAEKLETDTTLNKTRADAIGKAADILKWSAEKSDPNRYGNRQDKNTNNAVQIIIQTGISREPEEPKTIEVVNE